MGHGSHSKLLVYQMVNIPAPWFASGYELLVVYAGFLVDAWFLPSNRLLSHSPKSGSTIVCAPWFECFPSSPVKATARWKDPMFRSGSAPNRKPWIYHDISICVFDGPWTKEKWSSFPIQSNPIPLKFMKKSIKTLQNQVFHRFCTNIKSTIHKARFPGPKKTVWERFQLMPRHSRRCTEPASGDHFFKWLYVGKNQLNHKPAMTGIFYTTYKKWWFEGWCMFFLTHINYIYNYIILS